ncbi:hypothetical protein [Pantoea cypripedii]|uniref:Uncharacterized protein n=1 Tax=Pantoea cypripedii TaxID=55209 RepID=A0A6B9G469_PANCY|nr:hypothetical protein [Pantoea cypripedii]QGY29760.1 hypothetical protein CUN67_12800 [Pantoea cypripedii]
MPATPTDRLYGLTTSVAVKPAVDISADVNIQLYGPQTITTSTQTGTHTLTTTEGDRVLLTAQDNPIDNGIWISKPATWVRSPDFNGPRDVVNGTLVFSIFGDCWQVEAVNPVVIGTSQIHFRSTYPFSDSLNTLQRALRVPETFLNELPVIATRDGKFITFDSSGQPVMVTADDITADEAAARQHADANLQDQLTGNVPLEASAFSVISWHKQTVDNSVEIPDNMNAWSFGPVITVSPGQSVTIPENSYWTIANGQQVTNSGADVDYGEL